MLKGSIYVTDDMEMAMNLSFSHVIICISDESHNYQDFIKSTKANVASVLLPPPEAVMMELDNNLQGFKESYYMHLSQKEPTAFISLILRAIYNGRNILLYLTKQESQLSYINVFMQFFHEFFGITIGTQFNPYYFDTRFYPVVLNMLFLNDLMTAEEYILELPKDIFINVPDIVIKLAKELNPYVANKTLDGYIEFFNKYKMKVNQYNKNIIIPIGGIQ